MRKTISSTLRSLLFFLAAGMFLFSCEENKEEVKPSSAASITSLTLTVGDTDYAITFEDRQDTITVPYATALPATATVKAVTLSAKATGVKVGDSVTIPVSGTFTLTVTAEDDKTTGVYTITVEKEAESNGNGTSTGITFSEVARGTLTTATGTIPAVRDRWSLFEISAKSPVTKYRIGVKLSTAVAPTVEEMKSDSNVKVYDLDTDPIKIILATVMGSGMFDYFGGLDTDATPALENAVWTDTDITGDGFAGGRALTGTDEFTFRKSMLAPGTSYTVYGLDPNSSTVKVLLASFTTDAVNLDTYSGISSGNDLMQYLEPLLGTETITLHKDNYEVMPMQVFLSSKPMQVFQPGIIMQNSTLQTITQTGSYALNPEVTEEESILEFYYAVGDTSDYDNDALQMGQNSLFMLFKGITVSSNRLTTTRFSYNLLGDVRVTYNINYQE